MGKTKDTVVKLEQLDLTIINPGEDAHTNLKDLVSKRPAILNFIVGTWCPKCDAHIQGLVNASELLSTKHGPEVFIVSTEANKKLRNYFDKNGALGELPFRVISDKSKALINAFGLKVPIFGFAKPASVLIQSDESWRIISKGLASEEQLIEYTCSFIPNAIKAG
jgi:peroxiredoxin